MFNLPFFKKKSVSIFVVYSLSMAVSVTYASESKVDGLIRQMTLDEKISFLHGTVQGFDMSNQHDPENKAAVGFIPGVMRLGIPALRLTDGPAGARHPQYQATAMPAPVALAASFNPELARKYGAVIGVEARALDQDVLLSPMINIVRTPNAGRNFETFGEEPLLTAALVTEEIKGIQEKGLMATVKHFAGNNQESERGTGTSVIDERTLHEIYLPAFQAAVQANVASVMCAYNRLAIDGRGHDYSCSNSELLNDVLRKQWGFQGFVMTDWYATLFEQKAPDPTPISKGLDMEMPSGFFMGEPLKQAILKKQIPEASVDLAVHRILSQMERFKMLDDSVPARVSMADVASDHAAIALKTAEQGAVLLKNDNNILPLSAADLNNLLIIGPTAYVPVIGGGGSSHVKPKDYISPLDVLEKAEVKFKSLVGIDLDGVAIPMASLQTFNGQSGLERSLNSQASIVADINLVGNDALPAHSTVTWKGQLVAPETGEYEIKLHVRGGSATLKLGQGDRKGEPQLNTNGFFATTNRLLPTRDGFDLASFKVVLNKGEKLPLSVSGKAGENNMLSSSIVTPENPLEIRMAWVTPSARKATLDKAVAVAKAHHGKVLLFAFNEGTEGQDRPSLALPDHQDELIRAISKVNKNTIVVLNTGDPVTMPWLDQSPAILQMWYFGQEGAQATFNLLTGKVNPSGRLPVSFPVREKDTPLQTTAQFPGLNGRVEYKEGLLVGYRWYTTQHIQPMFAFGHGLSYTQFEYSNSQLEPTTTGYQMTFEIKNVGKYVGADVPQVYLGQSSSKDAMTPAQSLVGFKRVELQPGETRTISFPINQRMLSYWNTEKREWAVLKGMRDVMVCHSSTQCKSELTKSLVIQ